MAMTRLGGLLRRNVQLPAVFTTVRGIVSSKLFVGGLNFNTQEESLRQAFSPHGDIQEIKVITDRETGRSRGFGFITFTSEADAEAALQGMDGKVLDGRAIRVDYASATPPPRAAGFGAGGFGGRTSFGTADDDFGGGSFNRNAGPSGF